MPIVATYCHKYQPTVTIHAPDTHTKQAKIFYYSVSLK
jgi:hypothetical protein